MARLKVGPNKKESPDYIPPPPPLSPVSPSPNSAFRAVQPILTSSGFEFRDQIPESELAHLWEPEEGNEEPTFQFF